MFGANNKPFGSTTAFDGGSFGSSTPIGQGGGLFGAATQPTGSGLFGQPSSSFGTPASTSSNAFGGFGTTSTLGGLFGTAASSTQSTGGLFLDSTPAFGALRQTFDGFGTTNTGIGLFCQNTSTSTGSQSNGGSADNGGWNDNTSVELQAQSACHNNRSSTSNGNSGWNSTRKPEVPVVLVENLQNENVSIDERRDQFFESLDRGDVLIMRVINDTLLHDFKLLVLYKGLDGQKLDDLSVIMFLPKSELELVGGNLKSNDLIRAAVSSCSLHERKIFVTVDHDILGEEAGNAYLGKLDEEILPFYTGDLKIENCYVKINLDKLVELRNRFLERMNGIQTT